MKSTGRADPAQLEAEFGVRNYNPLPVVIARGEGSWVQDVGAAATSTPSPPTRPSTSATAIRAWWQPRTASSTGSPSPAAPS